MRASTPDSTRDLTPVCLLRPAGTTLDLRPKGEGNIASASPIDELDVARALIYRLLGRFLAQPPDAPLLARAKLLAGDAGPIGSALRALAEQAAATEPGAAKREYDTLFIGVARGELVPYASYYLTGFLHERPLARLRAEMARLGFAAIPGRSDPEDHIASVCEIMADLIETGDEAAQAGFFDRHLAPWTERFFADLEASASAVLYRPVGALGRALIDLDRQGFALTAPQRGAA